MNTDKQNIAPRRGRPALAPDDRKSANLKFRTRGDLRRRLEEEAAVSGRSVSEEVERRIERSFDDARIEEGFAKHLRSEANAGAFTMLAAMLGGNQNMKAVLDFAESYALLAARMRAEGLEGESAREAFADSCADAARKIGETAFETHAAWRAIHDLDPRGAHGLQQDDEVGHRLADQNDEIDAKGMVETAKRKSRVDRSDG